MKRFENVTKLSLHITLIDSNYYLLVLFDYVLDLSIVFFLLNQSWLDFAKSITLFTPDRSWNGSPSMRKGQEMF
jgi:hypothetical protein